MKTTIFFTISFFCLISFTTVKNRTDLQRENLKGKIKTVSEYGYSGNINRSQRYTFTIANYDENGNLTEKLYLTGDSVLMRKSVPVHNAKGQIIEEKVINPDGTLEDRYTYKYDINSNRILESVFMDDGSQYGFTSYKYDPKGLLIEEKRGSPDDNENYTTVTYKYDSLANQIQMNRLTVTAKSQVLETGNYTYEKFDKENNWIQQTSRFVNGHCNDYIVRRIDYY